MQGCQAVTPFGIPASLFYDRGKGWGRRSIERMWMASIAHPHSFLFYNGLRRCM
jgi:hypothetical protein